MTSEQIQDIKDQISRGFNTHCNVDLGRATGLINTGDLQGKLYEAYVLAELCEKLASHEGFSIILKEGSSLILRQKGGPIDRIKYPYFEARGHDKTYEIFTDVYFYAYSSKHRSKILEKRGFGDYHELDIAVVEHMGSDYLYNDEIRIAIECKHRTVKKFIVRELLGFRRELGLLSELKSTGFAVWPKTEVPADPPCVHMLYISDRKNLNQYIENCAFFGTYIEYLPIH